MAHELGNVVYYIKRQNFVRNKACRIGKRRVGKHGGYKDTMASAVTVINDMLDNLEEEGYKAAISFIEYLSDSRKKRTGKQGIAEGDTRHFFGG